MYNVILVATKYVIQKVRFIALNCDEVIMLTTKAKYQSIVMQLKIGGE